MNDKQTTDENKMSIQVSIFPSRWNHFVSVYCRNDRTIHKVYTAISRKVVGKNVHATIPKGDMGYDQFTVSDTVAFEPTFVTFL